mmetsp:Transcript_40122/g.59049  ORF Transcript_40122/g.59049 Transcript_40122/m.59049 type:complete len:166 (+) Transcript_40122:142-639(+)
MTRSAGTCSFRGGEGMTGMCRIALSVPLLKYRGATDIKETLLHEMIHAVDFLEHREREGHGKEFQAKMRSINAGLCADRYRPERGYTITIFHDFHAEVAHARAVRGVGGSRGRGRGTSRGRQRGRKRGGGGEREKREQKNPCYIINHTDTEMRARSNSKQRAKEG